MSLHVPPASPTRPASRLTPRRLLARAGPSLPWVAAAGRLAVRQLAAEAFGAPGYGLTLGSPKAEGFAAAPRDFRPADANLGKAVASGRFLLAGSVLDLEGRAGLRLDPWNRPSPTRRFAVELHRFEWLPALLVTGEKGAREGLILTLGWGETFGKWSPFAWGHETLPRRVFNLACGSRRLAGVAGEADRAKLADLLARQARHLLRLPDDRAHAAEHLTAAAVAGCALAGTAGDRLLKRALPRLRRALDRAVLADGCHASRNPEAGLELLLDLLSLDDALLQLGREPVKAVTGAIERLTSAMRVLTLADGRLACVQGGEAGSAARIDAARAHDEASRAAAESLPDGRYHRLQGQMLQVLVDAGAPAGGAYAADACAQPLAVEIVCGKDRIITNSGWSARAPERQGFRLTSAGSTVTLGEQSVLEPLQGPPAAVLGPRLEGPALRVDADRREADGAVLLELAHDGWGRAFGLEHRRSLFLDRKLDELRGEDRLAPLAGAEPAEDRPLATPMAARFHLEPGVQASLSRDKKSVLLRGASGRGWWFRTDAADVAIEPSVHFEQGLTRRSLQIVLRGTARTDAETRVRWKISPAGASDQAESPARSAPAEGPAE